LGSTETAIAALDNQLADLRELARHARTILRSVEQAEDAVFAALAELRREPGDSPLRGERLARVAEEILRASDGGAMHYRDVHHALRDAGHRVDGKDSAATVLTALSRSPRVRAVGNRTGIDQLAAEQPA
jgi:hypothetical protein